MLYSEYQNQPSSEKIVLATLNASKRLMGWSVHSGSVYKIENFEFSVISSLEEEGTAYQEVTSVGAVTAGKFFLDRSARTLYLRATGSGNPNGLFVVVTVTIFLANVPITLPFDLANGFQVFWEPQIRTNSEFGVEIDTVAQTSESIEGSGSLTLENDHEFWPANFDKLSFENQRAVLYSFNRKLDPSDRKIIFKGKVEKKTYGKDTIVFQLKDQFAELKAPIPLEVIDDLGQRSGEDLAQAKQRMILGRVFGHVPTNLDRVLDGYPVTGLVSITIGSLNLTGVGTEFLSELSPDDRIVLSGVEYTIATVDDDDALTLTEEYESGPNLSGDSTTVMPAKPKRHINRIFKVAGHSLRQPITQIEAGSSVSVLNVTDATDMYPGDTLYVGEIGFGESTIIDSIVGLHQVRLATSLGSVPSVGTVVTRPAIQNVRINDTQLIYYRDYTFDADTALLTLRRSAEANASAIFQMTDDITFTNGSRSVTGSGFRGVINPGYMLGMVGHSEFFEVLSVDSDTELTLRVDSTFTDTDSGLYKSLVFDEDETTLSLDALGRTDSGLSTGNLLATAPQITKKLIEDAGLGDEIDEDSFLEANELVYQKIGVVVPTSYSDRTTPIFRDVLNRINKSVFGAIVQNSDFKFAYQFLRPRKVTSALKFSESDILSFSMISTAEKVVKTSIIQYRPKEYNYVTKNSSVNQSQKTSDNATYVLRTDLERTIDTVLVDSLDSEIMAARWSFLLSRSTGRLTFETKLQGALLKIGDIIEVEHRKLFERYGSTAKRKLMMVEAVGRTGAGVKIEATDLSNTFNRVACINDNESDWSSASESERLYGGYITDQYGLIDNNPSSFETNLIW